ncbi:alpha/beta fold hydrolase [Actinoplanes sp. M2I2]|uniref:alpha/beta fold hydrolase n=1 Tax=Actinoplanes sp. M2I2 TaxID=1734444 RepID=UPI002021F86E|nr:alpha/beta hydrolase [Actinoplanes sp. M2I2]
MLHRSALARDDVELSVLRGGAGGEPVVLLHGLAGSAAEMAPLAGAVMAAGHRVVVPDQRGHGHSTSRPADVSREAYVADVLALIDEPAWLVGQSMGAHTAMLAAAARPDRVRGLVMIEGGVGGSTDDYPERLRAWFASWPVPFADVEAARAFLGDRTITEAWIADLERRAGGLWPRFDPDTMKAAIAGVASTARWTEWHSLTVPVLLILGEQGAIPADEVEGMAAARQVVVAGAGHDVHLDTPGETARLVVDFLSGGAAGGGPAGGGLVSGG